MKQIHRYVKIYWYLYKNTEKQTRMNEAYERITFINDLNVFVCNCVFN